MENRIAFIVLTCDKYSDLWPMYNHFFERFWPDCPYDKYFVTNDLDFDNSNFEFIKIGKDESWSDGLMKALEYLKIKYEYIFITLEDTPIIEKVSQKKISEILKTFYQLDGNFISFYTAGNNGAPTLKLNEYFGIIEKGALYRPNCVYSFWKISVLEDLLVREENAWEFERYGSVRSDKYDKFFMVYNNFFKISNTIVKGKWQMSEYKRIKKLGFTPDMSKRVQNTFCEEFYNKVYALFFKLIYKYLLPWRLSRKIVFKLKGYKY